VEASNDFAYAKAGHNETQRLHRLQAGNAKVCNALLYTLHLTGVCTVRRSVSMSELDWLYKYSNSCSCSCYCTAIVIRQVLLCIQRRLMPLSSLAE
jgi:hypothetical protein